jgi:hypothetical protein
MGRVPSYPSSGACAEGLEEAKPVGQRRWAITEAYIPGTSNGSKMQFTSLQSTHLLNTSDEDERIYSYPGDRIKGLLGPCVRAEITSSSIRWPI